MNGIADKEKGSESNTGKGKKNGKKARRKPSSNTITGKYEVLS
jgi:hypothetical protein